METTQEAYKQKMEAQIKEWSARLEVLKAKAEKATAEAKLEMHAQAEKLKALEVSAQEHLAKLQASAAGTWDTVKADVTEKWNQVSGAVEAIWAKV
jgi:hypothetical protein